MPRILISLLSVTWYIKNNFGTQNHDGLLGLLVIYANFLGYMSELTNNFDYKQSLIYKFVIKAYDAFCTKINDILFYWINLIMKGIGVFLGNVEEFMNVLIIRSK